MSSIRLLLVDDHPLVRDGLVARLDGVPGFEAAGPGAPAETMMTQSIFQHLTNEARTAFIVAFARHRGQRPPGSPMADPQTDDSVSLPLSAAAAGARPRGA